MKRALLAASMFAACTSSPKQPTTPPAEPPPEVTSPPPADPTPPVTPPAKATVLSVETPLATTLGNTFIGPPGWSVTVTGPATILTAPEGNSWIALVDVQAPDADAALKAAWAAYKPSATWPIQVTTDGPPKDGWTDRKSHTYLTSPNEKRGVLAAVQKANGVWTVVIVDIDIAVAEKRGAQLALIGGRLLPKDHKRESFAGKTANPLDAARIAALGKFVEQHAKALGIPGVSIGLVQKGKVVFSGGFGEKVLGSKAKPDGNTMFMIASNTKAMTTLLLAKLVESGKVTWETPAKSVLPTFKLGDAATTDSVQIKHLVCACTGLPRQDLEWLLEFKDLTPDKAMTVLGTMQPTSKFGEMFQYSNPLAAAAGYVGAHAAYPKLELGAAYDKAMQDLVFGPLGMTATTFDYKKAMKGNVAMPHSHTIDGKTAKAVHELNYSVIPVRPAGAAWSNVNDVLKYVAMELREGKLPNGKAYIAKEPLLERRKPMVATSKDSTYGMGLSVDTVYGTPVVHHGGDLIGYHSDMMWLPEHDVGAVILTNGDMGGALRSQFRKKLLEVLFDGNPEADDAMIATAKNFFTELASERALITVPADATATAALAAKYHSDALGDITVVKSGTTVTFDFGEFKSEMATRKNPDGTISFISIVPGANGFLFVVGAANGKPTLTTRDAQHEYVFTSL